MRFDLERPSQNATSHRVAVLLINLGTPDAPTPRAVRRYLAQFLSDPRVVEIPALLWQVILRLLILPFRGRASAKKYAAVWMPEGSPLRVFTEKQVEGLRHLLQLNDYTVLVDYAMRYGTPGIPAMLNQLKLAGVERVLLMPMYPQYSSSTTATAFDDAFSALKRMRNQPEIRTVRQYADHPAYIAALAAQVHQYWHQHGRPDFAAGDKLVLSFHGVPKRTMDLGDPYHEQCQQTGALLMQALGLTPGGMPHHVSVALRQGRMAAAVHRPHAEGTWARRACGVPTCSARALPPIALKRLKKSAWKCATSSCMRAARSFTGFPA